MTSIDTILSSVAPAEVRPDPAVVDADLARGRAALTAVRRRRAFRRVSLGVSAAAVVAGVVAVIAIGTGSTGSSRPSGADAQVAAPGNSRTAAQIRLVDYTGSQLPGFTVRQVPDGWHLSTSTSTALLITPDDGSLNNDPDDFEGKLAVLIQSSDEPGLGPGDAVTVNGQPGRLDSQAGGGVLLLRFDTPDGHVVDVQAPLSLHWASAQIVTFAEGVTVTQNVGVSHG
jgi:hypothetical protein